MKAVEIGLQSPRKLVLFVVLVCWVLFLGFLAIGFWSDCFGFGVLVFPQVLRLGSCCFVLFLGMGFYSLASISLVLTSKHIIWQIFCLCRTPPVHTMGSHAAKQEIQDSTLTFDDAVHVSGQQLKGPERANARKEDNKKKQHVKN